MPERKLQPASRQRRFVPQLFRGIVFFDSMEGVVLVTGHRACGAEIRRKITVEATYGPGRSDIVLRRETFPASRAVICGGWGIVFQPGFQSGGCKVV